MTWTLLQLAEIAAFAAIAGATHRYVIRRRGPFADAVVATGGASLRSVFAVADAVAALVYLAFVSAVVPAQDPTLSGPAGLEGALDQVALFALLVAFVQVVLHMVVHRVAAHLEPWPPRATAVAEVS